MVSAGCSRRSHRDPRPAGVPRSFEECSQRGALPRGGASPVSPECGTETWGLCPMRPRPETIPTPPGCGAATEGVPLPGPETDCSTPRGMRGTGSRVCDDDANDDVLGSHPDSGQRASPHDEIVTAGHFSLDDPSRRAVCPSAQEDSVMIEQGNAAKTERNGSRGAGAGPVPRSSSKKSDRPGRLSRAIRPPAHNQERVAVALVGARARRRRPAGLAAAVTRLLLWAAPLPALQANGVPATRAKPPEKSDPPRSICSCESPLYPESVESRRSPRGWCSLPANPHRCTSSCGDSLSFGAAARALVPASRVPATTATRATGTAANRARGSVPPLAGRASVHACRHPRPTGQHRVIRLV
jgi:hypothetical protein